MYNTNKHITLFEHQTLRLNQEINGVEFGINELKALQEFYGKNGVPYFSLIHNGVQFNEYVGVIQAGNTVIEILPKADNSNLNIESEQTKWRDILIEMLYAVGDFDVHTPSSSRLRLKHNSILDLYFELFINEVEHLVHKGLIKQYRKNEANVFALKGSINFSKHLSQNLVHKERFYTSHSVYDVKHQLHEILYKTILLIKQINTNIDLHSRIGALLLNFPEMNNINVTEATFSNIVYSRKNHHYKNAIDIAKLLLLKYHPDIKQGQNHVLALMFDMNLLWEKFIYKSLHSQIKRPNTINAQSRKSFWQPMSGRRSHIIPDIVINIDENNCIVLDTKWKNLGRANPSPDDLRQMYVYHSYYNARKVALIYPSHSDNISKGRYYDPSTGSHSNKECSIISIGVTTNLKEWLEKIGDLVLGWIDI